MKKDDMDLMLDAVRKTAQQKGYNQARREERIFLKKIRTMIHTNQDEEIVLELTARIRQIKDEQPKGLTIKQLREMGRGRRSDNR